jgi:hypothetical protein
MRILADLRFKGMTENAKLGIKSSLCFLKKMFFFLVENLFLICTDNF